MMTRRTDEIYQLKVTLKGIRSPIWRRLLVRGDTSLSELHDVVQAAMGWGNGHLHVFEVAGRSFGRPDPELEMDDDSNVTLGDIVKSGVKRFGYEYDFGDSWQHELLVEKTFPAEPDAGYPQVVKGKRACPPEDCGGVWGYAELLETLADPEHPEHEEMQDWLGGPLDPETFDLERANERLNRFR